MHFNWLFFISFRPSFEIQWVYVHLNKMMYFHHYVNIFSLTCSACNHCKKSMNSHFCFLIREILNNNLFYWCCQQNLSSIAINHPSTWNVQIYVCKYEANDYHSPHRERTLMIMLYSQAETLILWRSFDVLFSFVYIYDPWPDWLSGVSTNVLIAKQSMLVEIWEATNLTRLLPGLSKHLKVGTCTLWTNGENKTSLNYF